MNKKEEVNLDSLSFGSLLTNEADSVYLRTGLYFVTREAGAVRKRNPIFWERIVSLSTTPFASVDNVRDVEIIQTYYNGEEQPALILRFDKKGTMDLKNGTADGIHDSIAFVVAGKLIYVVKNENKISGGEVEISFNDFTPAQMLAIKHAILMKK